MISPSDYDKYNVQKNTEDYHSLDVKNVKNDSDKINQIIKKFDEDAKFLENPDDNIQYDYFNTDKKEKIVKNTNGIYTPSYLGNNMDSLLGLTSFLEKTEKTEFNNKKNKIDPDSTENKEIDQEKLEISRIFSNKLAKKLIDEKKDHISKPNMGVEITDAKRKLKDWMIRKQPLEKDLFLGYLDELANKAKTISLYKRVDDMKSYGVFDPSSAETMQNDLYKKMMINTNPSTASTKITNKNNDIHDNENSNNIQEGIPKLNNQIINENESESDNTSNYDIEDIEKNENIDLQNSTNHIGNTIENNSINKEENNNNTLDNELGMINNSSNTLAKNDEENTINYNENTNQTENKENLEQNKENFEQKNENSTNFVETSLDKEAGIVDSVNPFSENKNETNNLNIIQNENEGLENIQNETNSQNSENITNIEDKSTSKGILNKLNPFSKKAKKNFLKKETIKQNNPPNVISRNTKNNFTQKKLVKNSNKEYDSKFNKKIQNLKLSVYLIFI